MASDAIVLDLVLFIGEDALKIRLEGAWVAAIVCGSLLAIAGWQIARNQDAFTVIGTDFNGARKAGDWSKPGPNPPGFEPVVLPYLHDDGVFRSRFTSDRSTLDLDLFAEDCVMDVFVDGKRVYKRDKKCKRCATFAKNTRNRCESVHVSVDLKPQDEHLLAVRTANEREYHDNRYRDQMMYWVEHGQNGFVWRLLAVLSGLGLLLALAFAVRRHEMTSALRCWGDGLWRYRALIVLFVFAASARFMFAERMVTTDVYQSALIYTENLVNKQGTDFMTIDPQYARAAKYDGKSHLHKPPALYYQFAIPRVVFGWTEVYYKYLIRVPGMLGDLIIAFVLFGVVRRFRGNDSDGVMAAALFLLNPGTFITTSVVNRVDALPIGLVMLAMANSHRRRFVLYLGVAVALKQLAVLVVPWFMLHRKMWPKLFAAGGVTLLLCAPYLLDDPKLFMERIMLAQYQKAPTGISWMHSLRGSGVSSRVLTLVFFGLLLTLPVLIRPNRWVGVALTYSLFVTFAKSLHEHYILWSTGALLIVAMGYRRLLPMLAFGVGTIGMVLENEGYHWLDARLKLEWGIVTAVVYLLAVIDMIWMSRKAPVDRAHTFAEPTEPDPDPV